MSENNNKFDKLFVSYNIACELKKIGYNEDCLAYWFKAIHYAKKEELVLVNPDIAMDWNSVDESTGSAPTWEQITDWLRDEKGLEIEVSKSVVHFYDAYEKLLPPRYQYVIDAVGYTDDYLYHSADADEWYEDYYDAREQAVLKALEILKTK